MSEEGRAWWNKQRWRYNIGLILAGIGAFLCYSAVVSVFHERLPEAEITVFTVLFQGMGYLMMMGVANLCYCLGAFIEGRCSPKNPQRFRRVLFNLGFWFSVALPFTIPGLLLFLVLAVPVLD